MFIFYINDETIKLKNNIQNVLKNYEYVNNLFYFDNPFGKKVTISS